MMSHPTEETDMMTPDEMDEMAAGMSRDGGGMADGSVVQETCRVAVSVWAVGAQICERLDLILKHLDRMEMER